MKKTIIACVCMLSFWVGVLPLAGSPIVKPQIGRIYNGSFEKKNIGWELGEGCSLTDKQPYEGKYALALTSPAKGKDPSAQQRKIPLVPGVRYRLTYYVKAGSGSTETTGFQYFRVFTSWETSYGEVSQKDGLDWQDVFQSWQRKTLDFTSPNKKTDGLVITCTLRGPGTLYVDGFRLERIDAPKKESLFRIEVKSPYYRNLQYEGIADPIVGKIEVNSGNIATVRLVFGKKGEKSSLEQTYPVLNSRVAFTLPAMTTPGEYILMAVGLSPAGKVLDEQRQVLLKLPPSAGNEVLVREDNVLLVNGKPFFAIGLWNVSGLKRDLYELARAGFNTFRFDLGKGILDRAQEYQVKIMGNITESMPADSGNPRRKALEKDCREKITEFGRHPALLAYYLTDEPLWVGTPLEEIEASYDFHRTLDPYHPIFINEAPRNTIKDLARYGTACDIFGVDIYPIPEGGTHSEMADRTIACVGKYADKMRTTVADRKPIWMTLQGFAWAHLSNPTDQQAVYPTFEQTRFMAYDSVLHGATGILYWGTYSIAEPAFWDILLKTASELRDMSTVFVAKTVEPSPVAVDKAIVKFIHKECDGKNYLIAANEGKENITVTFSAPFKTRELTVFFEKRTVSVKESRFSDRFKPNEVHVYGDCRTLPGPLIAPPKMPVPEGKITFLETAERFSQCRNYTGKAAWICGPSGIKPASQRAFFRRTVQVNGKVKDASLLIAADDAASVYINGQKIGEVAEWQFARKLNIAPYIKEGTNLIALAVDGGAPPLGVICDITIRTQQNEIITILSDARWKASETEEKGWSEVIYNDQKWSKAYVVGPCGAYPWGPMGFLLTGDTSQ